jgi:hypothetical protein
LIVRQAEDRDMDRWRLITEVYMPTMNVLPALSRTGRTGRNLAYGIATAAALVAATGNIRFGLFYLLVISGMTALLRALGERGSARRV